MYTAFVEVLKDLWMFATGRDNSRAHLFTQVQLQLPEGRQEKITTIQSAPVLESRVCYVNKTTVPCLQTTQKKFDTLRGIFSYGDAVRVIQQKDQWSFVENSIIQGWVESTALSLQTDEVFPVLVNEYTYTAKSVETHKLRLCLKDELLGGQLALPLQATEYIFYRLKRKGNDFQWPLERPRTPGTWRNILQGKRGVSISLEPKTGSVVECSGEIGDFVLGYVETVTPAEELVVTAMSSTQTGVFLSLTLKKEQWQLWKPVFISFT